MQRACLRNQSTKLINPGIADDDCGGASTKVSSLITPHSTRIQVTLNISELQRAEIAQDDIEAIGVMDDIAPEYDVVVLGTGKLED